MRLLRVFCVIYHGTICEFILGWEAKIMETVSVQWPNGNAETLRNVAADAIYTITEGQGITSTQQLVPRTTTDAGASPSF